MSSHTHRHRQYAAQQMLSSYQRGMTVGNPVSLGDAAPVDPAGLAAVGATILTSVIGMVNAGSANKKNREHEAEMAELNAQALALSAKSQEAGLMAQMHASASANKRAITYASAGFASVLFIGSLAYLAMRRRKK